MYIHTVDASLLGVCFMLNTNLLKSCKNIQRIGILIITPLVHVSRYVSTLRIVLKVIPEH